MRKTNICLAVLTALTGSFWATAVFAPVTTIPSSSGISTPVSVANGGTGAATAAGALTNLGLGTTATVQVQELDLTGGAARTVSVIRETSTANTGAGLTVQAGGVMTGATNKAGGTLTLAPGTGTGNATASQVQIMSGYPGSSGTTDKTPTQAALFFNQSNMDSRFCIGTGTTSTCPFAITLGYTTSGTLGRYRNTTTVGDHITLEAGSAKSAGLNLAGGNLVLRTGVSTGQGTANIQLLTATPNTSSTTTDNTLAARATIDSTKMALTVPTNYAALSANPTVTATNADANVYVKGGKLVVQYSNTGTLIYSTLDMVAGTWSSGTTPP